MFTRNRLFLPVNSLINKVSYTRRMDAVSKYLPSYLLASRMKIKSDTERK